MNHRADPIDPAPSRPTRSGASGAGLLIALLGVAGGCGYGPRFKSTAEESFISSQPASVLVVENNVGDVTVLADAQATEFKAEVQKVGKGRSPEQADDALAQIMVTFANRADDPDVLEAIVKHPRQRGGRQYSVNWIITTPPDIELRLTNDVGDVEIDGVGHGTTIKADVGDIVATNIGGGLSITHDVGRVDASATGQIEIWNDVGDVRFEALDPGAESIKVWTDVGDARVYLPFGWQGSIDAYADVGSSTVSAGGAQLRVYRDRRGSFEGELGSGGAGSLIIRTDVGDARVRLPGSESPRDRLH